MKKQRQNKKTENTNSQNGQEFKLAKNVSLPQLSSSDLYRPLRGDVILSRGRKIQTHHAGKLESNSYSKQANKKVQWYKRIKSSE